MRSYRNGLYRCIRMVLLVVLILFPALGMDQIGLNSRVGLTTPVSAESGEGWYLDSPPVIDIVQELLKDGQGYTGKTLSIIDGSAASSMHAECYSPFRCSSTFTGTGTWTPPPPFMQLGSKYTFTVSAKLTDSGHCGVTTGSNVSYYVEKGICAFNASAGSAKTGTYTVGRRSPDTKMAVIIEVASTMTRGTATYNYTYKSSGTGTGTTGTGTGTGTVTGWTGTWAKTIGGVVQGANMELTQSGNNVTGYNSAADRFVKCIIDTDNLKICRGTWDKTNSMLAEMTLSPDGQTITVRTQFSEMKYFFPIETYTRRVSGASTVPGATAPTTTSTGAMLIAESRTAYPKSTVQVPIRLDKAGNIGSMNFMITYNAQVLKVNKVDGGSLLSGALFTPNYKTPPQVRFGLATSGGISGSGSVAYIEFQVIGAAGSSSPLTLSEVDTTDTSGKAVTVTTRNGTVTVASAGGTDGASGADGAGGTDGAGGKIKGDYNGDGKVTELDALAALKMSVKLLTEDLILDMDGNGKVTAEDARLILKKAMGK